MEMFGKPVKFSSTRAAIQAGIGVVPQERNLIPGFSVGENILLEKMPVQAGTFVDYRQIKPEAQKWLDVMRLEISPGEMVADLSAAQMQLVETAKALALNSQVLLLDEPTASITPHEVTFLFNVLRDLRDRGVAILFVTHKLEEVMELCDRVTVLRDGHNVASGEMMAGLTRDQLVTWMIGRTQEITELPAEATIRRRARAGAPQPERRKRDPGRQLQALPGRGARSLWPGGRRPHRAGARPHRGQQDHRRRAPGERQARPSQRRLDGHDQVQDRLRQRKPQDRRPDPVAQHPLQRVDHRSGSGSRACSAGCAAPKSDRSCRITSRSWMSRPPRWNSG